VLSTVQPNVARMVTNPRFCAHPNASGTFHQVECFHCGDWEAHLNIRNKFGDVDPNRRLGSAQRTLSIAGEAHTLDDGKAATLFVDVVTEAGAANGMVFIGLGHLIFPPEGKAEVQGDVHLRLSVPMAASLIETLSDALRKASDQQSKLGSTRKTN
jgi:hypothetical protein